MDTDIKNKLATARTSLILEKPFLGALALRLPLVEADPGWCTTAMTDAKAVYYNRDYIQSLDRQETGFVLAKHALHCGLSHFARRAQRKKHLWALACDYAVNPVLIADGLKAPAGTLTDVRYEGMAAEEIYPLLEDESEDDEKDETETEQQQDEQAEDSTDDQDNDNEGEQERDQSLAQPPPELTPQEQEELAREWRQRLAGAAQTAQQADKLDGAIARLVEDMLQPTLPWRAMLAHYMTASARDDYAYTRPSSRRGDDIIFPSLRSNQINIAVGIDTSGSVKAKEMNAFLSEVDSIKGTLRARITLLPCDNALPDDAPYIFEPWEHTTLPDELMGGGGTSFVPVFEWLDAQDQPPDLLVYFTDAKGRFPKVASSYPVIWLVKGKVEVPWGERVQLN